MRFGICSSSSHWKEIAEIGYDFAEYNLSALAQATDEKFDSILQAQKESGIRVEACNGFFPANFKLYAYHEDGSENAEDFAQIKQTVLHYVEGVFPRAEQLGVRVAILGSAGARSIPGGVDRTMAERQFLQILRICADVGQKHGILITLEPLNYSETNFLNTAAEGLDFARRAEHMNVGAMVDFYHHYYNKESLDTFGGAMPLLSHVHLANPMRNNPTALDSKFIAERMEILRTIGYDGRVSLECNMGEDFVLSAKDSYELLKQYK